MKDFLPLKLRRNAGGSGSPDQHTARRFHHKERCRCCATVAAALHGDLAALGEWEAVAPSRSVQDARGRTNCTHDRTSDQRQQTRA
jgi:hypothetical protein